MWQSLSAAPRVGRRVVWEVSFSDTAGPVETLDKATRFRGEVFD
jgi:hypothetical protein